MDNSFEVTCAEMDDTRAALSEKLETLEQRMVDTVHGAADAVAQTVDNVREAVHDTVENVRETFDLRHQVARHPWGMVGGSVALGFVAGYFLVRPRAAQPMANGLSLRNPCGTEVVKLRKLAIGTLVSIVRDMITGPAPETMRAALTEVFDGITVRMGGEPVRGPVLNAAASTT